jgi:intracellular septation protein
MANLMHSARLLVTDLASTLLFLAVLLITKDLMLAVGWASVSASSRSSG